MDVDALVRTDLVGPWLAGVTGDTAWGDCRAELIAGGKSNLTFLLTSPAGRLVLRRPPSGTLLPTAHDMAREARVQRALAGTPVPVARIVAQDGGELLGVPCYVMTHVDGVVVRDELPEGFADTPGERRRLGLSLVDTLAAVHRVRPGSVGLDGFGRPDGFCARQVRRWGRQWDATRGGGQPDVDRLREGLTRAVPADSASTIVHGDFRIDNVVLDAADAGTVKAVLDWEMSTLGDPLTDLGLLLLYWRQPGERAFGAIPNTTRAEGFPTRGEVVDRYLAATGRRGADLAWYRAFAHFKFAVIVQGVGVRAAAGDMAGQDFGDVTDEVGWLAADGLAALAGRD